MTILFCRCCHKIFKNMNREACRVSEQMDAMLEDRHLPECCMCFLSRAHCSRPYHLRGLYMSKSCYVLMPSFLLIRMRPLHRSAVLVETVNARFQELYTSLSTHFY